MTLRAAQSSTIAGLKALEMQLDELERTARAAPSDAERELRSTLDRLADAVDAARLAVAT